MRGYVCITTPTLWGGDIINECDIVLCKHCDRVVEIKPGKDVHRCTCCNGLVCDLCVGKGCHPMEEKLLEWESRAALSRSLGD